MVNYDVTLPLKVTFTLFSGWIKSEDELNNVRSSLCELSSTTMNRWMKAHDTERKEMDFEKDGIYGSLFVPAEGPFPGNICINLICIDEEIKESKKYIILKNT